MYAKYPQMQVQDAVKLLYQSEFGGGHMIADSEKSLARILWEWNEMIEIEDEKRQNSDNNSRDSHEEKENRKDFIGLSDGIGQNESLEYIGDGICRMYLSVLDQGLRPDTLNRMFVLSASQKKGTTEGFEKKLLELVKCCESGEIPFEVDEVQEYLAGYQVQGYPAVSHSETYRTHYHPAYRVVAEQYARYYPVFLEIDRMMAAVEDGKPVVVAIDGMCGAGKSTLGNLLHEVYDCNLFHMDDFFLRPEQRTPERFAEVGGNVDYERFKTEILDHISDSKGVSYQVFDCRKWALGERFFVPHKKLNIIEGSYSQHPYFGDVYDLRFFCGIEEEEQLKRIELRNGSALLERFKNEWIPMENRYLETFEIRKNSMDLTLCNSIEVSGLQGIF